MPRDRLGLKKVREMRGNGGYPKAVIDEFTRALLFEHSLPRRTLGHSWGLLSPNITLRTVVTIMKKISVPMALQARMQSV